MTSPAATWQQIALLKGPKGDAGGPGPAGRGIQSALINENGRLVIAFTDGTTLDLGDVVGPAGEPGKSVAIAGSVPSAIDLPALGAGDAGTGYLTLNDGHLHVWDGDSYLDVGPVRGPKGDKGDPGATGPRGTVWFNGDGPPPAGVPGSQFGDYWLDRTTGVAWQLV